MASTYDTHAHLDHLENLDQALENARQAGVSGILAMSMDLKSCQRNLEIKHSVANPKIFLGMGIHPSEVNLDDLSTCLNLARNHAQDLSLIGEIGLDFWYKDVRKNDEKKAQQRQIFKAFLELAKELNLPAVVHARGTWAECLQTLKDTGIKKANFHWYSGPLDILKDILSAGYFISASPALAYSPPVIEAIKYAPINQVLIETDCPVFFKMDEHDPGFKSEPKDVFRTLEFYCRIKNMDKEKAVESFNNNVNNFLKRG